MTPSTVVLTVTPFVFGASFALLGIIFATDARIFRRLRANHPAVWESLGRPTLIRNNSIENMSRVRKFIRRGEFRELRDGELEKAITLKRRTERVYVIFIVILFGTIAWQLRS